MPDSRRGFLKRLGAAAGLTLFGNKRTARASGPPPAADQIGVLVDTTLCVGCRRCEKACNDVNRDLPRKPAEFFTDDSVFNTRRRMDSTTYTVVNRYESDSGAGKPVYAKFQCMHCLYPACVSACIVGAFSRQTNGAVVYDSWKCIGCRYCMAACPFQVPAYEFSNILTPQVRKCTFCFETRLKDGTVPACVQACPMQVMTFGKRTELIKTGRKKIRGSPGRYFPGIYGENEAGGTAWMYLSGGSFERLDLPALGYHPAPGYTEPIQHTLFKWFLPPMGLYAVLGGIMWFLKPDRRRKKP